MTEHQRNDRGNSAVSPWSERANHGIDDETLAELDLSDHQQRFVQLLPATYSEIADAMGFTEAYIRKLRQRTSEAGVPLKREEGGGEGKAALIYLDGAAAVRQQARAGPAQRTIADREYRDEVMAGLERELWDKPPITADHTYTAGNEDAVFALSDLHFGDVVTDSTGREVYNLAITEQLVEHYIRKGIDITANTINSTIDTAHLVLGGDIVTGETIYEGQHWDVAQIDRQLGSAISALTHAIKSLAATYPTVQVVTQVGNHGETRNKGSSKASNWDLVVYNAVYDRLGEAGVENVDFHPPNEHHCQNFQLRGGEWNVHLRHGQNVIGHIEATRTSNDEWKTIKLDHDFDVALFGHHHKYRQTDLLDMYPIWSLPSPKPSDDFAEKINSPSLANHRTVGVVFGVNDDHRRTWDFPIRDTSADIDPHAPAVNDRQRPLTPTSM